MGSRGTKRAFCCSILNIKEWYVQLDGHRVRYRSAGAGNRALVFLHGLGCNLDLWRLQAPVLQEHARLLFIDLPGHGASDKPVIPYTVDLHLAAVSAVLDHAGVDRVIPVGHSMGGGIAYQFVRRNPRRCPALIWVDGTFAIPAQIDEQIADNQRRAADFRGLDGPVFIREFVESMFTPATPAAVRAEITAAFLATPAHVLASCLEGLVERSLFNLERLDIPVLALFCRFWKPEPWLDLIRSYLPQIEIDLLDDVGHYPMLETPAVVNQALASFLSR